METVGNAIKLSKYLQGDRWTEKLTLVTVSIWVMKQVKQHVNYAGIFIRGKMQISKRTNTILHTTIET